MASHQRRIGVLLGHLKTKEQQTVRSSDTSLQPTSGTLSMAYYGLLGGDPEISSRHGGDLAADVFCEHGVKFVFTLVGGHISPVLVASKARGIRIIDVRHEVNAVFAADAVGRLTGAPGVAAVTAGPGVTNTITAVKNAAMAQSPLVLIGGAAATIMQGRGSLQDIDQFALMEPLVKKVFMVRAVRDIVPMLREAFQLATSGVPGPVFVELPIDVLYPIIETKAGMGMLERMRKKDIDALPDAETKRLRRRICMPKEFKGDAKAFLESKGPQEGVFLNPETFKNSFIVRRALDFKLKALWGGAFQHTDYSPLPVSTPTPNAADVAAVAAMLRTAKNPVLLLGSGAMLAGGYERAAQLQTAINQVLRVPTFLGGMSRGLLGRNSDFHIRQNRKAALARADLVLLCGVVCDFRLDYGRALSSKSKIVAINRDPKMLSLNSGLFWSATRTSQTDPTLFLLMLADQVAKSNGRDQERFKEWTQSLKKAEADKEASNIRKSKELSLGRGSKSGKPLVNPIALLHSVEQLLPPDSILVADGGDFVATASYVLRPRGPLSWLDPGAFGTLGVGAGFALGAKLVRPSAEVWLIWGDGSAGYSIAEFDTFARHGIPVIGLIGNDACWTQIEREQIPMFKDDVACPLEYCAYGTVSNGYGAEGLDITAPEQVEAGLRAAQAIAASGKAVVVNVHIGKTDFREGSLSV